MFTGIITDIGRVRRVDQTERDRRYEIETVWDVSGIDLGASISHAGCCLTVVEKGEGWFAVEVSDETLSKTTLGAWVEGEAEPLRITRSLVFAQGLVTADGVPCARVSGVFKIGPAVNHDAVE